MKSLVVYYSQFGNTKRVAETIGATLQSAASARTVSADALAVEDLVGIDLLVAGAPTHVGNLPKAVRPILEALPKGVLRGALVATFDTSYKMSGLAAKFTAAKPLLRKLRKLGGKRVVRPETFSVEAKEGPLCEGEIDRAKAWAVALLSKVNGPSQPRRTGPQ